jgi:hypothetical protein
MPAPSSIRSHDERELLDRASDCRHCPELADLTADALRQVTLSEGIDFATALLYDRIRRSRAHGPLIRRLETPAKSQNEENEFGFIRFGERGCVSAPSDIGRDLKIVIVPGAFYVESPHSGANGQAVIDEAHRLGFRTARIPVRGFGSLKDNSRLILDWLDKRADEPVVLVSLSKGGADVKIALAQEDASSAFRNVVAWIDLSGILNGTPLADWLLSRKLRSLFLRPFFWFRGHSFEVIRDLSRRVGSPLSGRAILPKRLKSIHVVGFPLRRHLSNALMRRGHCRLAPFGPNDGAIVLADVCTFPGAVYPVWGADHYLQSRDADLRELFARILRYIGEEVLAASAAREPSQ